MCHITLMASNDSRLADTIVICVVWVDYITCICKLTCVCDGEQTRNHRTMFHVR